jgi:hypothetical protein
MRRGAKHEPHAPGHQGFNREWTLLSTAAIMSGRLTGMGHNRPGPIERAQDLVTAANRWSIEVPAIRDHDQAGRAQDFVGQLREAKAALEASEKEERAPHDAMVVAVRLKYRDPLALISIAYERLQGLLTPWLTKERNRIAAARIQQERDAQRLRDDAKAALAKRQIDSSIEAELAAERALEAAADAMRAAARAIERPMVRGELSNKATSLRTFWSAEITDDEMALVHFARHPAVRAATLVEVRKVANRLAREAKDESAAPPGCRFIKEEKAV